MIRFSPTSSYATRFFAGRTRVLPLHRAFLFMPAATRPWGALAAVCLSKGATITFAALSLAAIMIYVAAVNAMLLDGEAIRHDRERILALERDRASLLKLVAEHSSPSWLERRSQEAGMVHVSGLRYLSTDSSFALSR